MSPPRTERARRARTFVDFVLRYGVWLWGIALALAVPAAWRTAQLYAHLRSDLEALLPHDAPSARAIDELRARMPGLQHLGVIADAGSADRLPDAERFLDDLAARIRAYPAGTVSDVRTGDAAERRFVEDHAALYMDAGDLRTALRRIEARRDWEVARATGALLDENAPPPPIAFDDLKLKYEGRTGGTGALDHGRYSSVRQHTTLLLIEVGRFDTGRSRGEALLTRVKADVAALDPRRYAPGLRVGFTGDVAIQVEETQALVADLTLATLVVVALEAIVVLLYYRWWKSLVVLLPPLLLAAVFTFAIASLPPLRVTELNSNTAFLGSIIVGNGVNFGIVLLARYVEERRLGRDVHTSLVLAVRGARGGTAAAALAAGVAYASLALTDFRGFRQFGLVGGLGMLLAWALAFLLMPPLLAWTDRAPALPAARGWIMPALTDFVERRRAAVLVVSAALAAAAAWQVSHLGPGWIETDFSKLRRADTWTRGEGYWGRRMDALLGSYVTPMVILTDDLAQARAVDAALAAEIRTPPLDALVATARSLDDVVPPRQSEKLAIAAEIRDALTPRVLASLDEPQRRFADEWLGRSSLAPITAADVPPALTTGLRERDGTLGREVLVFPRPTHELWEGPRLEDLVARLRAAAATRASPEERAGRLAGSLALSSDILASVRRDGALSSAAAFAGVIAVVLLLLRWKRSTALVLGSLLLGVLWLTAASSALGVKINFANFIAYPITFGIGVDYAVNVANRWELDRYRSMTEAVRTTGGAVALCSTTTIIGYSSLLLAENRALFSFGLLAVLGEIACLTTALVVMPALSRYWVPEGGGAMWRTLYPPGV